MVGWARLGVDWRHFWWRAVPAATAERSPANVAGAGRGVGRRLPVNCIDVSVVGGNTSRVLAVGSWAVAIAVARLCKACGGRCSALPWGRRAGVRVAAQGWGGGSVGHPRPTGQVATTPLRTVWHGRTCCSSQSPAARLASSPCAWTAWRMREAQLASRRFPPDLRWAFIPASRGGLAACACAAF